MMNDDINFYRDVFGLGRAIFHRVDHKDAMVAAVYRVENHSRDPLILKICPSINDFQREVYFLSALKGFFPVPNLHNMIEPTKDRAGAILMESLNGSLLKECDWTHELAYDVGSKLAMLHTQRFDVYGDIAQPKRNTRNSQKFFEEKFFQELEECRDHLPKQMIKSCKEYYESHKELLHSVDGPCLVHRDFRPGNIIVYDGKLIGIIDWASARLGFAEQDFCSMEHRNWPSHSEHKRALLEGYSSVRKISDYEAVMPLLRLGRALAVIGLTVKRATWNGKDKEIYHYNRKFLDQILDE